MEMESVQTVPEVSARLDELGALADDARQPQEEPPTVENEAVRPPSKMKKSDKAYAKQQALLESE